MIEFFEVMFRALTGLKLTMPNLIMIFMFFVLGYAFAKFAKNIGVVKALFVVIVGYFIASILSALLGVFSLAFALGFLSNQGMFIYRVISWAESLSEIYYSLQYRPMFEELQSRERALQEEINRLREELNRQKSQRQKSSTQQKQRTSTQNSQQSHSRNQSGSQQRKSKSEFDRCLKVLGLEVGRDYTQKDVKKAYRRLAMKYHPDMPTGDHQAFLKINNAMEYLMKHLD